MEEFLGTTCYCNHDDEEIRSIAVDFLTRFPEARSRAVALFYYVRDKTKYTVGNWDKKASETLRTGYGTCTNSANLLVALLRATGIPAGYGIMDVRGRDYFGPIVPSKFRRNISKKTKHVYCYVNLNERWLTCDPSDDEPLSLNTQHLNPQSKLVEWDGENHAMLNLQQEDIISNIGPLPNIDHIMEKKMRWALRIPVRIADTYIEFLRNHGATIEDVSHIDKNYENWLRKKHKMYYIIYKYFFWWQHIGLFRRR